MSALAAALAYAHRGWPVFPKPGGRFVKGGHGWKDATVREDQIKEWWQRWPDALIGCPTGRISGLIVLDVDRHEESDGFLTLERLGYSVLPRTPMATTPHDGLHLYFQDREHWRLFTTHGEHGLGAGLDVLGENGSVTLPTPGSRYVWDAACNPDTIPFLVAPTWFAHREIREHQTMGGYDWRMTPIDLLNFALDEIRTARPGVRHEKINKYAFTLGAYVARGLLEQEPTRAKIRDAALAMCMATGGDPKKAQHDLDAAFRDGITKGASSGSTSHSTRRRQR